MTQTHQKLSTNATSIVLMSAPQPANAQVEFLSREARWRQSVWGLFASGDVLKSDMPQFDVVEQLLDGTYLIRRRAVLGEAKS